MSRYNLALIFATVAHGDQTRKNPAIPYIAHPIAVSKMLPHPINILGLLHDVLEDTSATLENNTLKFENFTFSLSTTEAEALDLLTHKCNQSYENYITEIATSSNKAAKLVKLADIYHNSTDNPSGKSLKKYQWAIKTILASL